MQLSTLRHFGRYRDMWWDIKIYKFEIYKVEVNKMKIQKKLKNF